MFNNSKINSANHENLYIQGQKTGKRRKYFRKIALKLLSLSLTPTANHVWIREISSLILCAII